jgi:tight adherence protein B
VPDEDDSVARFLTAVASELRTGVSLSQAVQAASETAVRAGSPAAVPGPLGPPLRTAIAANRAGVPLVDAMAGWGRAWPTPAVCLAVTTLTVGAGVGGELARAADAAASTLRQRSAVRAEVRALSAQGRASAVVVSVAPLAFTVVACILDPDVLGFLTGSWWGLGCIAGGLTSDLFGALWMRRIIRGVA